MAKKTPGTWGYRQQASGTWCVEQKGATIAHVYGSRTSVEGNARLIAAAPDLLVLLNKIVAAVESSRSQNFSELWNEARAAIAKAESK